MLYEVSPPLPGTTRSDRIRGLFQLPYDVKYPNGRVKWQ